MSFVVPCEKTLNGKKKREMNLKSYTDIFVIINVVPTFIVLIIGLILRYCFFKKSERLMLLIMKGIVSRKNIDKKCTYLVCNMKLPAPSSGLWRMVYKTTPFYLYSVFIIILCVYVFFLTAIIDVTYKCIHDPDLDCFKKKDDVKLSDNDEPPVNCSTISRDDFVTCYRLTFLDPERTFVGAATVYLLFKIANIGLLVVAHIMLSMAKVMKKRSSWLCFKLGFAFLIVVALFLPAMLSIYVVEVKSTFRKVSFTVLLQVIAVAVVVGYFVIAVPWEHFCGNDEYYEDVSLPDNDVGSGDDLPDNDDGSGDELIGFRRMSHDSVQQNYDNYGTI